MLTMLLRGTVPFSVMTSSAEDEESTVTLSTWLATSGLKVVVLVPSVEEAWMVYWPAAAVPPVLVVPFQLK
jgi:hypothetical protein